MIIAGVVIDQEQERILKAYGVKDSKKLTREKREELFNVIVNFSYSFIVVKAMPYEIDSENLNKLTYRKVIEIISASIPFNPNIVTVDKVGDEVEVIEVIRKINAIPNVVHNADEKFIEASAASIIAKVIRDRIIDSLKDKYGDFGSGYPSDPKTVKWIKDRYYKGEPPPEILRRTWKNLLKIAPNYYINKGSLYGY